MSILKNKYGFDLGCLEQDIFIRVINNKLSIEGMDETNINNHYSCSLSYDKSLRTTQLYDKEKQEIIIINIDNVPLEFVTHKDQPRGYLHHYTYITKIKGYWIQLYLPVNAVLDEKDFFTTTKIERRWLKIKQLKEKLKKS